jgi:hypothetical protein
MKNNNSQTLDGRDNRGRYIKGCWSPKRRPADSPPRGSATFDLDASALEKLRRIGPAWGSQRDAVEAAIEALPDEPPKPAPSHS